MKDPAFLFYSQDFYIGTATMSFEDRGKYITLLCLMHQQGRMTEESICFLVGTISPTLKSKFKVDNDGFWYNERLEKEAERRNKYSESRSLNALSRRLPKGKNNKKSHIKAYAKAYAKDMKVHSENEIINENEYRNNTKRGGAGGEEVYQQCVKIYFEKYESQVGIKPGFNAVKGKNLKQLIGKIKNSIQQNGKEVNDKSITDAYTVLLDRLPEWIRKSLDISVINSKYDEIIATIRSAGKSKNDDVWQRFAQQQGFSN